MAALIVVVSHFSNASGLWGKVLGHGAGQLGVMLFFMLSGFLMTHLYWGKEPTSANLLAYAVSRAARVLPLYLLVVFFSFLTPYFYDIENVRVLIAHLVFLHGNKVLWTIPPEIQFYALFGLTWSLLWHRRALVPLVLAVAFVVPFLYNYRGGTSEFFGFPVTASIVKAISYFTVGCVLGGLYKHRKNLLAYQSDWYLFALGLLLMLYPSIFIALFGFKHAMWRDVGVLTVVGIVFSCIVFLVPDGNSLLENKPGDLFGKISYSLYLLHTPVLALLTRIGWTKYGAFSLLIFVVITSSMAWVTFKLVEAPSRRAIRSMVARP